MRSERATAYVERDRGGAKCCTECDAMPRSGASPLTLKCRRRTGPWALAVDVGALDGRTRGLDAQTNALVVARIPATLLGLANHALLPNEDAILLLERPLVLPG